MSFIRPMLPSDLLKISSTNLDPLTETYNVGFYLEYLSKWPDLCRVIEGHDGHIEGYSECSASYSFWYLALFSFYGVSSYIPRLAALERMGSIYPT
jgi:ribosomal protein S18 acetylase RimI-like enzyme